MLSEPTAVVNINARCAKCGGRANVSHCAGGRVMPSCPRNEHMHRKCLTCSYEWLEKCLPTGYVPLTVEQLITLSTSYPPARKRTDYSRSE